jgi:hypothetical protein
MMYYIIESVGGHLNGFMAKELTQRFWLLESIYLSIYLSICLFIYLFISLSISLSIYLSMALQPLWTLAAFSVS